ncbi:hypothetical protein PAXINDRAFT_13542 [Paxillus involutus ATCC 200175]|uniref:Uncharacterized protein n=1 Tax=Paxillus involutus ATCC 200175 TaxID=664439 RepID=A0A0C9TTL2_PAXIN|nr:hypothetical protein PAXINDRAFT_13542 [Paxillus involutus ATCC 200175]
MSCSSTAFSAGDVVDIAFTFDIFIMRTWHNRRVVRAHLNLEHVLQLTPARHTEMFMASSPNSQEAPLSVGRAAMMFQDMAQI